MRIGYVCKPGRGAVDAVLAEVTERLEGQGLRLAGAVQSNRERPDRALCDMDLRVLPDGPEFRISQDLGNAAKGCRLDPSALEQAVAAASARLAGAQLLIINKFGKHEAEGRGFRDLIAEALARDIPVLIGVNGLNLPAFTEFAGDLAEALPPDAVAVAGWLARHLKAAA